MYNARIERPAGIEGFVFSRTGSQFTPSKSLFFTQHDHFTLVWINSGSGTLYIDMESFPVHPKTLYCILPGQLHRLQLRGEANGYEIKFTKNFLSDSIAPLPKALIHPNPTAQVKPLGCDDHLAEEVDDIFQEMLLEYSNDYSSKTDMLQGLLFLVISHFQQDEVISGTKRLACSDKTIWLRFIEHVENNFRQQKQVREYAAELAVTPNYLTEIVRRASGCSPRHHIHQRILLEAKRLAVSSSRPAVDIALDLGFDNPFTFSKFFKTVTGTTFSDFRKNYSLLRLPAFED